MKSVITGAVLSAALIVFAVIAVVELIAEGIAVIARAVGL